MQVMEANVAELPELLHKLKNIESAYIAAGFDALLFESLCGDFADTPDFLHRQPSKEIVALRRGYHVLTVGLVPVGSNLGDKLVRRDAGGYGNADSCSDALSNFLCDQGRAATAAWAGGNIKKGLIERQRFDQIGVVGKNFMHLPRGLAIHRHAPRNQNQLRAAFNRGRTRHRRMNPELACLVARGSDDPATSRAAANRYRFASQ